MSKRFWIISLIGALILAGGAAVGGRHLLNLRARQWLREANAAVQIGDYARASDLYARYLHRNGGDTHTLRQYIKARELAELPNGQHLAETAAALKILLGLEPDSLDERRHLLDLYVKLERGPEALDTANSILATAPNDVRTLKLKVQTLRRMQQDREAMAVAEQWTRSAPLDLDAQMAYFELRFALREQLSLSSDAIMAAASGLVAKHPEDPRFELLLGFAYAHSDARDAAGMAREWLNKAANHSGLSDEFIERVIAQFDALGMLQDSVAVLRDKVSKGAGASVRHLLAGRCWEHGNWAEAVDLLGDVDPKNVKADPNLVAFKAIALSNLGRKSEALSVRTALASRNQAAVRAWTLLMQRIVDAAAVDDKQIISECQAALLLDPANSYLNYYLGDSCARLGENDLAIEAWQRALAANPTWPVPSVRLIDALLQKGQNDQALRIASFAQRTNNAAAVIMMARASAAHLDSGGSGDIDNLLKGVDEVRRQLPGDEQTQLVQIDLLAQKGNKEAAVSAGRILISRTSPADERGLISLASISRRYGLGLERDAFAASETSHGLTPALAYARAVAELLAGHSEAGLQSLDDQARRAGKQKDMEWRLSRARYLDVSNNPAAHDAWVALGDAFPQSASVQQTAASARSVSRDWDFMQRTIDRLRALTGEKGLEWRMAEARLLVGDPRSDADFERGSVLLNDILRTNNLLPEPHVLLARALVRMKRLDGAIDHLTLATKLDPNNIPVALQLAALLQSKGDFDRVRQELDRITPGLQSSEQRQNAALLLARQNDPGKATHILENARPGDAAPPSLMLAMLYRQQHQLDKADAVVAKLLESPDVATIQFAASLYASENRKSEAEKVLTQIDSLKLEAGVKELVLGDYAFQNGDVASASQHYQAATRQAPGNSVAWRTLAACQLLAGKVPEMVATIESAARALPASSGFPAIREQSRLVAKAAADAHLQAILLSILRDPGHADVEFELLRVISDGRQSNDNDHLASQLQQFTERHPELLAAHLQLVQVYMSMGRMNDAFATAQRAMSAFGSSAEPAEAAVQVAAAAARWQDMQSAAQVWKRRLADNPQRADVAIAQAQLGMRQYNAALTQLQPYIAAAKADPQKNPDVLTDYCIALVNSGSADQAADCLWPLAQNDSQWRARWMQVALGCTDIAVADQWLDRVSAIIPPTASMERVMLAESYDRLAATTADARILEKANQGYKQVADDPGVSAVALLAAGSRAERRGDGTTAEALYRRAVAMDRTLVIAENNLAMIIARNGGNIAEAERYAAAAVQAQPHVAAFRDTLAFVQARARNYKAAADSEKIAIELEPDQINWRVRQADYLLSNGNLQEASNAVRALDDARLDARKAPRETLQELESIRSRMRAAKA